MNKSVNRILQDNPFSIILFPTGNIQVLLDQQIMNIIRLMSWPVNHHPNSFYPMITFIREPTFDHIVSHQAKKILTLTPIDQHEAREKKKGEHV